MVSCRKRLSYLWQRFITPFGRMSLTNYIGQSIIGVACYYHFGLDLWDKTGAAETLLIGIAIFMALLAFSRKWLATHSQITGISMETRHMDPCRP